MGRIMDKLGELGYELPPPQVFPNPNRTGAVQVGVLLFVSGHPPAPLDGVKLTGKIPADLSEEDGYIAARACALNILRTVQQALGDLDRIRRVVKLLGFINTVPGFEREFAVMDGASDLYLALFGADGVSTRAAVGVADLARGIPVEIEAVFQIET